MKKIKHTLYIFLPLLSIAMVIAVYFIFKRIYAEFNFHDILDESITIMLMSISSIIICFIDTSNHDNKLYIVCSTFIFIGSIRLLVSSIMGLLTINKWSIEDIVCFSVCILTMGALAAALSGAFLLKQRTVHISVNILAITHMTILVILALTLNRACLIYTSCLPLLLTNLIREVQINKGVAQNEVEG